MDGSDHWIALKLAYKRLFPRTPSYETQPSYQYQLVLYLFTKEVFGIIYLLKFDTMTTSMHK